VNGGTEGDHTAGQRFGTVKARYPRNSQTQIHQIYRKILTQPPHKMEEKLFQNVGRVAGGRPHQKIK